MKKNIFINSYPPVSIVILTFNGSCYIEALLFSLLDQSYPEELMEIIVVDNASTDNTRSIVQKHFPSVKLIALEKNTGFAAGNNHGVKHAQHDFIAFLNQDTVCHQKWLYSLMHVMLTDKNTAACNSNIIFATPKDTLDRVGQFEYLEYCDLSILGYGRYHTIFEEVVSTRLLSGCAFVIRRSILRDLQYLFDENFWMYAEDTDLSLRIHNLGKKICVTRDSIVFHLHNTNVKIRAKSLSISAKAIMNRVFAFYKNLDFAEFMFFYPVLLSGGMFKIFEFQIKPIKKAVLFIPFGLFSVGCMILALFGLADYASEKKRIIKTRCISRFSILKKIIFKLP